MTSARPAEAHCLIHQGTTTAGADVSVHACNAAKLVTHDRGLPPRLQRLRPARHTLLDATGTVTNNPLAHDLPAALARLQRDLAHAVRRRRPSGGLAPRAPRAASPSTTQQVQLQDVPLSTALQRAAEPLYVLQ